MADKRNVTLGVGVEVSGEDQIQQLGTELQSASEKAKALGSAESAARSEALAQRTALNEQRDALALLRAESDRATKGTAEYEAKERALRVAIVEAKTALRDKEAAVKAASAQTREAAAAESALADKIKATAAANAAAVRESAGNLAPVTAAVEGLKGQLAALRNIALAATGGSLVGSLAKDIGETADQYRNLSARVELATGKGAAFNETFRGIFDIANKTGTAVESVGALATKLINAGHEIGITNQQALALTSTITEALALGGATVQEQASAVLQLSQALASGKLQGDELRSILESGPVLAKALADGLGTTVGQLKELGATGALTSQQVVGALLGQQAAVQRQFDTLPPTVGRALAQLSNAWEQYVGQASQASGASVTAAEAIQALARNLDTVIATLLGAAKAGAAFLALRFAGALVETAAAASTVAAAQTTATAATTANTAATVANAAAQAASVASAGRLAGVLSTIKTFSFVAILTNLREIGTAIGEGVAKLTGADKPLIELERAARADAEAARADAAARADLAQRLQQQADKAAGLTVEAKKLAAEYEELRKKGDSAAEALEKVGKNLDLSDVRGIQTALAALDSLAARGLVTAQQVRDTIGKALKDADLGTFATTAAAAFDKSEQGARRLQAALDAVADESLRRAGTSVRELQTGFSAASVSAINDVDALAATLARLGIKSDDTQRALTKALDQALTAANTERAVQAVIDRTVDFGKSGALAGQAYADGLDKAKTKLDDLKSGINSMDEALRAFGLKTRDELQTTATKLEAAYLKIAGSARVSLQDQAKAYEAWRDSAVAAGQNVDTGQLKLQGTILANKVAAAGLGDSIVVSMGRAEGATNKAVTAQEKYLALLRSDPQRLVGGNGLAGIQNSGNPGPAVSTIVSGSTRTATGQFTPPDNSGDWYLPQSALDYIARNPYITDNAVKSLWVRKSGTSGPAGYQYQHDANGNPIPGSATYNGVPVAPAPAPAPPQIVVPAPAAAPAAAPAVYTTNVSFVGEPTRAISTTDSQSSENLLKVLEAAARAGGYSLG